MGRVLTNATSLQVAYEASTGVLPASPIWYVVEFETVGAFGAEITTVARRPISQDRGRKKGAVIDLDSSVEFETDLTIDALQLFIEGFMFAEFANVEFNLRAGGASPVPPPATATGYTVDSASALLAGKVIWVVTGPQTLVYAKGYAVAANNGVKVLTADLAASGVEITVAGLTIETPPTNASLQVAGLRTDDVTVTINANGTGTLVSAADITWVDHGVFVGMELHIGGADADLTVLNAPTIAALATWGPVRVTSLAGSTLNFDKAKTTLDAAGDLNDGASSGSETIDFMIGRFARNVPVTANVDDSRYLERTHQFEGGYPGLGGPGLTEYEYPIGNFANELTFNLPLVNKSTVNFGFIGTNSDDIVVAASRKTNAATPIEVLRTTAFGTGVDLASITTDVVSAVSDVCFKSLTMTWLNNVSPEKCLGTLGARFVNAGLFEFNLEGQMLFTNKQIINAIKNNTTVTFAAVLRNEDGMIAIDAPELTLGGGGREFPVDQSVLVNITGQSFTSSTFGHDVAVTIFPVVPTAA